MKKPEHEVDDQVAEWIRILRGNRPLDNGIVKSALLCSLEHIQELRRRIEQLERESARKADHD